MLPDPLKDAVFSSADGDLLEDVVSGRIPSNERQRGRDAEEGLHLGSLYGEMVGF